MRNRRLLHADVSSATDTPNEMQSRLFGGERPVKKLAWACEQRFLSLDHTTDSGGVQRRLQSQVTAQKK